MKIQDVRITHWKPYPYPDDGQRVYVSYRNRFIQYRWKETPAWALIKDPIRFKLSLILMGDMSRKKRPLGEMVDTKRLIKLLRIKKPKRRKRGKG